MQSKDIGYKTGLPLAGYSIYISGNANKTREHFFLFLGTADWADFTCSSIQQHDSWPAVGVAATDTAVWGGGAGDKADEWFQTGAETEHS